jgi:hypothetical protein
MKAAAVGRGDANRIGRTVAGVEKQFHAAERPIVEQHRSGNGMLSTRRSEPKKAAQAHQANRRQSTGNEAPGHGFFCTAAGAATTLVRSAESFFARTASRCAPAMPLRASAAFVAEEPPATTGARRRLVADFINRISYARSNSCWLLVSMVECSSKSRSAAGTRSILVLQKVSLKTDSAGAAQRWHRLSRS